MKVEFEVEGKKYVAVKPSVKDEQDAKRHYDKVYIPLFRDKCLLEFEVEKVARERGVWDDARQQRVNDILKKIQLKERELAGRVGDLTLEEKKAVAWEIGRLRREAMDTEQSLTELTRMTAESRAEAERVDFLVHRSIRENESGKLKLAFGSAEEYQGLDKKGDLYKKASEAFVKAYYGDRLDQYKKNPEFKFLFKHGFCDDQGRPVGPDGELVDDNGRAIDSEGRLLSKDGEIINEFGDPLDELGNIISEDY